MTCLFGRGLPPWCGTPVVVASQTRVLLFEQAIGMRFSGYVQLGRERLPTAIFFALDHAVVLRVTSNEHTTGGKHRLTTARIATSPELITPKRFRHIWGGT